MFLKINEKKIFRRKRLEKSETWLYCEICCIVICEGVMYKEILD